MESHTSGFLGKCCMSCFDYDGCIILDALMDASIEIDNLEFHCSEYTPLGKAGIVRSDL